MMEMHDYVKSENTASITGTWQQQKIATVISKDENTATIAGIWEQPVAYLCEFFADPGHPFLSFEPVQSGTNQPLYTYPPILQHNYTSKE
jgi:3,4-dihydroxy-2-butanone 4-phosphate synthase